MQGWRKTVPVVFGLLVLFWFGASWIPPVSIERPAMTPSEPSPGGSRAVDAFADFLRKHPDTRSLSGRELEEAVALAKDRREWMKKTMVSDPAAALAQALTRSARENLHPELRPYFEEHFNANAGLFIHPNCDGGATTRVLEIDGREFQAHLFGSRSTQASREDAPLHGITLDNLAAVAESPLEKPRAGDEAHIAAWPLGNPDPERDFFNGEPLGENPVEVLAGGKRYRVRADTDLDEINRRLSKLDSFPGPHGGSRLVFAMQPMAADGSAGVSWEWVEAATRELASAWTESPKNVFFLSVDFSDAPAEGPAPAQLASRLNGSVAASLSEMSYAKTTLNATVAPQVLRMAKPSTDYLPASSGTLRDDALAAYKAIHGENSLDGFDIVGVHFPSIGMQSGGVVYAGLASLGGSRQYLQGNIGDGTIIHEFGHNYGLLHASFWQTSDGSVAGAGSNVEYGDPFDIMGNGDPPWGHFHMRGKQRLNWLAEPNWSDTAATGSGTFRLYRFDHPQTTGALRALRIPKASAPSESYWLGYRAGVPDNEYLQNGAYLLWERPGGDREWLLDATPNSPAGREDSAIGIGRTYSDPAAGIHITPLSKGGSGADAWLDVRVNQGPFAGNQPPQASLNAPATVQARIPATFSVSATDPDGDELAYGWDMGHPPAYVNAPQITQTWITGGNRTIEVDVSDMKGGVTVQSRTVQVLDPLDQWTPTTVASGRTMVEAAYLGGRFLLGGNSYIYTSFDGISWRQTRISTNYRPEAFAWLAGTFVAVGFDWNGSAWEGVVHTSSDGVLWQKSTALPAVPELRAVAAGNGVLVAVGDDGAIVRSTDKGLSWTRHDIPAFTTALTSVAFGDGVFLCAGGLAVHSSGDGISWTDRSAGIGISSWKSPIRTLRHHAGLFLAGGWYSLLYSPDAGVTWHEASVAGGADYDVKSLASDGLVVIAAANRRTAPIGDVLLVSIDGKNWEESMVAGFPSTGSLAMGGGRFFTTHGSGGEFLASAPLDPANQAPAVSISAAATGEARNPLTLSASANDPDGDELLIVWNLNDGSPLRQGSSLSHSFTTGGEYTVTVTATDTRGGVSTANHTIHVSDPLATWSTRASGTTAEFHDIVFADGKLVAVGASSGTYRISTDGITWSGGTIALNVILRGIVHNGSLFVAVGENYDFGASKWTGTIYTSPEGTTWTRRLFTGAELHDVAYGNGNLVAVGDAGTAWASSDGIAWSPIATGTSDDLRSIAFGGGGFVAVGPGTRGSTVLTSANGLDWTDRSAGTSLDWQEMETVARSGDQFFAGGWYVGIRRSMDGGQSFQAAVDEDLDMQAFAHGNGIHFAAGVDLADAFADKTLISLDGAQWFDLATPGVPDRNAAVFFENTFLTVGKNGSIRQSGEFQPVVSNGFEAWVAAREGLSGPSAAWDADPDGDGAVNLLEYAFGTDPVASGQRPSPPEIPIGPGSSIRFSIVVRGGDSALSVVPRATNNLAATWSGDGIVEIPGVDQLGVPEGFVRRAWEIPAPDPAKQFLRFEISLE